MILPRDRRGGAQEAPPQAVDVNEVCAGRQFGEHTARAPREKALDSSRIRDGMKDDSLAMRDPPGLRCDSRLVRRRRVEDQVHVVIKRRLRSGEANGDLRGTAASGVQRRDDVDDLQATAFASRR